VGSGLTAAAHPEIKKTTGFFGLSICSLL